MIPSARYTLSLAVLIGSVLIAGNSYAGSAADDAAFERLKQQIREQSKDNPAEGEQLITSLEADRILARRYAEKPEELERDLLAIVTQLAELNTPAHVEKFAEARSDLQDKIEWLAQQKVPVSVATANKVAHSVFDIYEKRASFTNLPDALPITVAAKFARSERTKSFLKRVLAGPEGELKQHALVELAWSRSLKGDDEIFVALERMLKTDDKNYGAILGAMSRLDRKRALPIVLNLVDTTNDLERFTKGSDILSEYGRVELLDHPLARLGDFRRSGLASRNNPTLGIYPELLLKYIEQAEGKRLERGLAALGQSVNALAKCEPVIRKKLESPDAATRRSVADFLSRAPYVPALRTPAFIGHLEKRVADEADPSIQKALRESVSRAKEKRRLHK